jgi:hypothetical protein
MAACRALRTLWYVEWDVPWGALTNMRTQPASTIDTALDQMVWAARGILNESPQLVSDLFGILTALGGGVRRRTNTSAERAAASCQCRRALGHRGEELERALDTRTVDLEQNGNSITGHFKRAE